MSTIEIEPSDIIRLLEQYLKENNLFRTLEALQDETSVSLNTVDSLETFVNDINLGHWDVVLRVVKLLKLSDGKLMDLYEQIAIELIELRETRAANWLIHKTDPMVRLKTVAPDRYLHLQNLLGRSYFDQKEAYRDGSSKEQRRAAIADVLKKEVTVAPPQRLLTLIGDALKWQRHEGLLSNETSIDLFTGRPHMVHAEEETFPNVLHKHCIKPLKNVGDSDEGPIFVCCADFSPDGHHIVVAYSTGLIEVRNPTTGRLAFDLKYQSQRNYMVTPSKKAALSLCFSSNDMLAVGDRAGDISVWKLETGQLIQLFKSVHHKGIGCLMFDRSKKKILSGSHDTTVKLHGIRSNKTIRDFRGHKSFVNAVAFSRDENYILSGGSDSSVKIWNVNTAQMLKEFKSPFRVHTILAIPNIKSDMFLIGDRSRCLQMIDLDGRVKSKLHDEETKEKSDKKVDDSDGVEKNCAKNIEKVSADFYSACLSPKGNWIYAVDTNKIHCFNSTNKKLQKRLLAHEDTNNDLIGIKHHPYLNLVATFDTQGNLKLWKP